MLRIPFEQRPCQAPVTGPLYHIDLSLVTHCPCCGFDLISRDVYSFCPACGVDLGEELLARCKHCGDPVPPEQGFQLEGGVLCFRCVELLWLFDKIGRLDFFETLLACQKAREGALWFKGGQPREVAYRGEGDAAKEPEQGAGKPVQLQLW